MDRARPYWLPMSHHRSSKAQPVDSPRLLPQWTLGLAVAALTLITGTQPAKAQQQPADSRANPVEYSLLLPGIAGKYYVVTLDDLTGGLAIGGHINSLRSKSLRELVARESYDAGSVLAVALKEELEAAGYRTEIEPVPRAQPGQPQRLSRSDLPTSPNGLFLIDVVIDSIGLAAEINGAKWQPAFELSLRVIRPSGEMVVPTHRFWHGPSALKQVNEIGRTECKLPSFHATLKQPQSLWDCFDLGLREASRALVPLIREKQDAALHGIPKAVTDAARVEVEAVPEGTRACKKARRPRDVLDGECKPDRK